jgi:hypothetical protein
MTKYPETVADARIEQTLLRRAINRNIWCITKCLSRDTQEALLDSERKIQEAQSKLNEAKYESQDIIQRAFTQI